tara:strand:+ start:876 stop:1115 length:240 start_codon:yes stop_codon:yes gene_type:complete
VQLSFVVDSFGIVLFQILEAYIRIGIVAASVVLEQVFAEHISAVYSVACLKALNNMDIPASGFQSIAHKHSNYSSTSTQ